jgi:auxin influx carrier (AUX1 LAX family)
MGMDGWWVESERLTRPISSSQIGQIMLVMPRAMWLTGMAAGMAVSGLAVLAGGWTLYVLLALYLEFKGRRVGTPLKPAGRPPAAEDEAVDPPIDPGLRREVVQYHDVVAMLGSPAAGAAVQVLTAVALLGLAVAQILACATNTYAAVGGDVPGRAGADSLSKRTYALAWGGAMLAFTAVPSYRDTRVINGIALLGTTFTAWYIVVASKPAAAAAAAAAGLVRLPPTPLGPASARNFFLGGTIIIGSLSGHVICMEIFDALGGSRRFLGAYLLAQVWVLTLTVLPAGVAASAFGSSLARADSIYGVLPPSTNRSVSAWLMNVHQVVVFGMVLMPLYYYAERGVGLHGRGALGRLTGARRFAARMCARMPISLIVWVLALAFPFYGAINALITAISFPTLSFLVPCALYNWVYGRRGASGAAARAAAPFPPPTLGGRVSLRAAWGASLAFNWVLAVTGFAFMCGALFFSIGAVVSGVRADGVFARCWQCGG